MEFATSLTGRMPFTSLYGWSSWAARWDFSYKSHQQNLSFCFSGLLFGLLDTRRCGSLGYRRLLQHHWQGGSLRAGLPRRESQPPKAPGISVQVTVCPDWSSDSFAIQTIYNMWAYFQLATNIFLLGLTSMEKWRPCCLRQYPALSGKTTFRQRAVR